MPKVSIVILNWNGAEDTIKCLDSFSQLQYPNYELVVVDNGSTDGSVEQIKARFPDIILIETGNNLGYSGGNNVGIKYGLESGKDYFLIVNNDTESVNPYFIQKIVEKMEEDQSVGIIGPRILNPGGQVQDTILFTPTLLNCMKKSLDLRSGPKETKKNYNISKIVEAVSGVCWLIRKEVIDDVGFLDEDYFMYVEEQDYCYRAQKAGWKVMYCPVESILHYKEPDDKNKERNYRQYVYARRNLILFFYKHFGFFQALMLAALFLASNLLKVVISLMIKKETFYSISLLSVLTYEFSSVLNGKWKNDKERGTIKRNNL